MLVNSVTQPVYLSQGKKKSMPKWLQLPSFVLYFPPFLTRLRLQESQPGHSEPWWGAACAQSRPCRCMLDHQMKRGVGLHSVQQPPVSHRKRKPAAIVQRHWTPSLLSPPKRVSDSFFFSSQTETISFGVVQTVHFWVMSVWKGKAKSQMCSLSVM